jgi:hypothetical protein
MGGKRNGRFQAAIGGKQPFVQIAEQWANRLIG